jgi:hypothetical protein
MRGSGSPPLSKLVELSHSRPSNVLSASLARASNGAYVRHGSDHNPRLLPLRQGLPELEVAAALETDRPASGSATTGVYLTFRYVLTQRDGTFTRGKDSRGDTVAVWEARFGELADEDFHVAGVKTGTGNARLRREALRRDGARLLRPGAPPVREADWRLRARALIRTRRECG